MFAKGKEGETVEKAETTAATSPAAKPQKWGRNVPSIFSEDVTIEGTLRSAGDVQFDGTINGNIHSGVLTIGEKATINGEVLADEVSVYGRVVGTVRANSVNLMSSAHVEGDVFHNSLAVESGAFFQGQCKRVDNPTSDAAPRSKSDSASASQKSDKADVAKRPDAKSGVTSSAA